MTKALNHVSFVAALTTVFPMQLFEASARAVGLDDDSAPELQRRAFETLSKPEFFDLHNTGLAEACRRAIEYEARAMFAETAAAAARAAAPAALPATPEALPARDMKTIMPLAREGFPRMVVLEHKPTGRRFEGQGPTLDEAMAAAQAALRAGLCQ